VTPNRPLNRPERYVIARTDGDRHGLEGDRGPAEKEIAVNGAGPLAAELDHLHED
jgi:hypothetical protein